jgi:hypothetical protein
MALTEDQKRKIEEEEAYREKVREDSQTSKKGRSGCSGCLVALLVIGVLLGMTLIAINPQEQFERAEKNARLSQALQIKNGSFKDFSGKEYTYEITYQEGNNRYVASYTPFLENNDRTLLMAIFLAFETAYGSDGRVVPTPILEERSGINLIKFDGDGETYYVSPIKEDTGEIHTLMFWKE